eukprot:397732-Hanusia_phi.AAC.2
MALGNRKRLAANPAEEAGVGWDEMKIHFVRSVWALGEESDGVSRWGGRNLWFSICWYSTVAIVMLGDTSADLLSHQLLLLAE